MKSAARQMSHKARSGLVFCRCDAAFVSPREGSAVSWLVSSEGQKKKQGHLLFLAQNTSVQQSIKDKLQAYAMNLIRILNVRASAVIGSELPFELQLLYNVFSLILSNTLN